MAGRIVLGLLVCTGLRLAAQALPQAPPGEYTSADIAYGARLYDAQCTTCHGSNGDGVGGGDLRTGKFRNGGTDHDLARVSTHGGPRTGMRAFASNAPELSSPLAYLRVM